MASEALNSRTASVTAVEKPSTGPESWNSTTAALVADENLDPVAVVKAGNPTEMAPETAVVAEENPSMGPQELNSRTTVAVAADENLDQIALVAAKNPAASPSLLKRPRLETSAKVQEYYLANCLVKLASSSCASGSVPSATATQTASTAVIDKKQTQFQKSQKESHNCIVCDKSFPSYQALGGHKSIHTYKSTNHGSSSTSAPPGDVSTLNHSKMSYVCSICHKSFNTGQALGRHKRLHYERRIDCPSGGDNGRIHASESTIATTEVAVENLEMALNPPPPPTTTTPAVQSLDMVPSTPNSTVAAEAEPSPSPRWTVDTFESFPKKPRTRRPRFVAPASLEEYLAQCLTLLARSNSNGGSSTRNNANSVANPNASTAINNQKETDFLEHQNPSYKCPVCNKSFTTYQALGGHKTSHRNKPTKNNVLSTSCGPGNVSPPNPSGKAHVCSVCHKSFNTGQALGGHKRMHYEGNIGINNGGGGNGVFPDTPREQNMVQREDLYLEKKRGGDIIVHDFDLNLPAQLEPESEVGLNIDSEMKTEVYGDREVDQDHLPMKKRPLTIKLDLRLSLS